MADYDAILSVGAVVDEGLISKQISSIANRLPAVKLKIDDAPLGRISKSVGDFEKSLAASQARVLAFSAAAGQIYLVTKAFDSLVKSTIDVQKSITDINVVLGLSTGQLGKFSNDIFRIGNLTGQSFRDVAKVALDFSRQGLQVNEVLKRTADALTLVRLGGTDLETSIKAITSTLNAFNEVGLDSTTILNKIATVDTKFAVSGGVIAEALTRVSSTAKDANVSFDTLIGMITAAQQITSRGGSVIGNSLKSIFQRIERPQVLEQLKQLGIATEDYNGEALSADRILTSLAQKYDTLTNAQKNQVTQLAAGVFQANQFKALMGDLAKVNGIAARATDTASTATDQAARRQALLNETLASQLNATLNNLTQFGAKAGNLSIAPALKNIFKGVDFLTGSGQDDVGKFLGKGLLEGLGNYLSGPGLALAGVLITKFFTNFASYATKSLATIIETQTKQYQQQFAINSLLEARPDLQKELASLEGDQLKIEQALTSEFLKQNTLLNERTSIANKISSSTSQPTLLNLYQGKQGAFTVNNEEKLSINPNAGKKGLIPNFAENPLLDAISRERAAGIDISKIRVGTSPALISSDNLLGMGIYNTQDEPGGLSQGIQRTLSRGGDPKKSGIIPSFADYYRRSLFNDPFSGERTGDNLLITPEDKSQIESVIKSLKDEIRFGIHSQQELSQKVSNLGAEFDLTSESMANINASLQKSKAYFDRIQGKQDYTNSHLLNPPGYSNAQAEARIQQMVGIEGINQPDYKSVFYNGLEKRKVFITPPPDDFLKQRRRQISEEYNSGINRPARLARMVNPDLLGALPDTEESINRKSILQKALKQNRERIDNSSYINPITERKNRLLEQQENYVKYISTQQAEDKLNKLNILDATFGKLLPGSRYNNAVNFAKSNDTPDSLNRANKRLANQGLMASFLLPLGAGIAQQGFTSAFGDDSTTKRGINASIGGLGNIGSFAAAGLAFGPEGAVPGAIIGLFSELPSIIKGFSDTLPDLQRNLNNLKETSISSNEAFSQYITSSEQLDSIRKGEQKVRVGTYNQLQSKNDESFSKLPQEDKDRIRKLLDKGDFAGAYEVKDIRSSINSQNENLAVDLATLTKKTQSYDTDLITTDNIKGYNPKARGQGSPQDIIKRREDARNEINPYISEILNLQNLNGLSLQKVLEGTSPEKINKLTPSNLSDFLKGNSYTEDTIKGATGLISGIQKRGPGAELLLQDQLSSASVQNRYNDNQVFEVKLNPIKKELDDFNKRMTELAISGADAVNNFETNVINKLSKNLTKLKQDSIQDETNIKIQGINSGNNPFNKSYLDYSKTLKNANNQYEVETTSINSNFQKNTIKNIVPDIFDLQKQLSKGKKSSGLINTSRGALLDNQLSSLGDVFDGTVDIDIDSGKISISKKPITSNTIKSIISKLKERNNLLDRTSQEPSSFLVNASNILNNPEFSKSNPTGTLNQALQFPGLKDSTLVKGFAEQYEKLPSDIKKDLGNQTPSTIDDYKQSVESSKEIIKANQDIIDKLNNGLNDYKLQLQSARNTLKSNNDVASTQLSGNLKVLTAEYLKAIQTLSFEGSSNRTLNAQVFSNNYASLVASPLEKVQLSARNQKLSSQKDIINGLNDSTNLGITNINQLQPKYIEQLSVLNQLQSIKNPTNDQKFQLSTTQGNVNELSKAIEQNSNVTKDNTQYLEQQIKLISPFSSDQNLSLRDININKAARGELTGSDYKNALGAGLGLNYNNKDFDKDTIGLVQDLGDVLRTSLSSGLKEAAQNAKSAGDFFRNLGLSIAGTIASKGSTIGINELLGLAGNAAGFSLKQAAGGYIPRFAKGGLVNMGSGVRDDVPAFLSGGEFVINRKAVDKIGVANLDAVNNSSFVNPSFSRDAGVETDSIGGSNTSAIIKLANAYDINDAGTTGVSNTSALLSTIGQTNDNPQNKLRAFREKWLIGYKQYQTQKQAGLDNYALGQWLSLGTAFLSAAGSGIGGALSPNAAFASNSVGKTLSPEDEIKSIQTAGLSSNTPYSFGPQYNTSGINSITAGLPYDSTSNFGGLSSSNYLSLFSTVSKTGLGSASSVLRANGGYIPKFSGGGYFGGDSNSDKFRAMVMGGEYVISPKAVNSYGKSFFNNLNNSAKYAAGGSVSSNYLQDNQGDLSKVISTLEEIRDGFKNGNNPPVVQNSNTAGQTNHVTINLTMAPDGTPQSQSSQETVAGTNSNTKAQTDKINALKQTSQLIQTQVIQTLNKEMRAGGILERKFQTRQQ